MSKKILPLALGVAMATAMTSAFAAELVVLDPVQPVVAVVTLPITVADAVVSALLPPPPMPPAPVVARY
jgi:hypothetical protein